MTKRNEIKKLIGQKLVDLFIKLAIDHELSLADGADVIISFYANNILSLPISEEDALIFMEDTKKTLENAAYFSIQQVNDNVNLKLSDLGSLVHQ